jgi:exosortase
VVGAVAWLAVAAVLYGPLFPRLVADWGTDAMYSHGFLVIPIAAWLVWRRRDAWHSIPAQPANGGFWVLLLGVGILTAGTLGAELFLTRVSLIPVVAGTIAYVYGWRRLRVVAFPIVFLIFMIPLPTIVFDRLAVSLQLAASTLGERLLQAANVPVYRDGNLLRLARGTLDVDDACSGIRSIVALVMTTALVGYLAEMGPFRRLVLIAASVPLAIVLNGARVAVTGLTVTQFGMSAAEGMVHTLTGWLVFVGALACVWGLHHVLDTRPHQQTALEGA